MKATVKDKSNTETLNHLYTFKNSSTNLEIVEINLTDSQRKWERVLAGCIAVMHVACPNPFKAFKREIDQIYPAIEGTLSILAAMLKLGIKRIVLTSSTGAIKGGNY